MNTEAILSAYRRYAGVYDILFGPIFHPGRQLIVQALDLRPGDNVLEVGVGTGLSLPLYPEDVRVIGIDISREMLDKARARIARAELGNVAVQEMDAEAMQFVDASFDKVVAMYVVSVVPDPVALVEEMHRVCKPDGDIFIVSHFHSRNPLLAGFEDLLSRVSKQAGFRPDLDLDRFLEETRLEVVAMHEVNLFGYWKMLHCRNKVKRPVAPDGE